MQNKKGQIYIILIILILALAIFFFLRTTAPDEDAERADISGEVIKELEENLGFQGVRDPIDTTKSRFFFEGFGPGKSHEGKFINWEGELFLENQKITGFEGTIQTNSISTGIGGLDTHLQSEDFFNTASFPTIEFISTNLRLEKLSGDLTFLGTTKPISFPVTITEESIAADFILDTEPFGKLNDKANKEVRIFFELFK